MSDRNKNKSPDTKGASSNKLLTIHPLSSDQRGQSEGVLNQESFIKFASQIATIERDAARRLERNSSEPKVSSLEELKKVQEIPGFAERKTKPASDIPMGKLEVFPGLKVKSEKAESKKKE